MRSALAMPRRLRTLRLLEALCRAIVLCTASAPSAAKWLAAPLLSPKASASPAAPHRRSPLCAAAAMRASVHMPMRPRLKERTASGEA